MIPILYNGDETAFTSNGLGRLAECTECRVTEERNGIYECEFVYPISGAMYDQIQEGRIIAATHDNNGDVQPFDIYGRSAPIDGLVTFYAHHISYRLGHIILLPYSANSCAAALAGLGSHSLTYNPFNFSTDKSVNANWAISAPVSIKEILGGVQGSILDVYGTGEYEWDKWNVKLWLHRGSSKAVDVRYGVNLLDITNEIDFSGTYSAVAPFWASVDGDRIVRLPEWIIVSSSVLTRLYGLNNASFVEITDENGNQIDLNAPIIEPVPMDLSGDFLDEPTVEELRNRAQSLLANSKKWLPTQNIEVDFVALSQTEDFKNVAPLLAVNLCDKINVYDERLGVNAVEMEVIKTTFNTLTESYDSIELGDPKTTFADTIISDVQAVNQNRPTTEAVSAAITNATKLLSGGLGGYVVFTLNASGQPEEILILDNPDKDSAVNVIRMNQNGIGFSTSGYNGPYTTAWTIDGNFVADFITSGTLNADLLRAGTIQDANGNSVWDLINSTLLTKNIIIDGGTIDIETGVEFFGFHVGQFGDIAIGRKPSNLSTFQNNRCNFQVNNQGYVKLQRLQFWASANDDPTNDLDFYGAFRTSAIDDTWNGIPAGVTFRDINDNLIINFSASGIKMWNHVNMATDVEVGGNFTVSGSKNRKIKTGDYGERLLYAYETPAPLFGDVGDGICDDAGECRIWIDPIFAQTINPNGYQVFLQAYGDGHVWVSRRESACFVVRGDPGLAFAWEIKARQIDDNGRRLDSPVFMISNTVDYSVKAQEHLEEVREGRIS